MEGAPISLDEILLDETGGGTGSSKYVKGLFQACLQGAKASNAIPTEDEDFAFRASTSPEFQKAMDSEGERLRRLLQSVVGRALPAHEVDFAHGGADGIANADSAAFEAVTDAVDVLTEKVDDFIDDHTANRGAANGAAGEGNKQRSVARGQLVAGSSSSSSSSSVGGASADASASGKPQERFVDGPPANGRLSRFVPKLSCKPHASLRSLADSLRPAAEEAEEEEEQDEDEPGARAPPSFGHPYAAEVRALEDGGSGEGAGLAPWMLAPNDPAPLPPPLPAADARPLPISGVLAPKAGVPGWAVVLVDTASKFEEMMTYLLETEADGQAPRWRELAVDLEAHSHRSFQSFTCLLQLSTRERDYLVDVLALRQLRHPASVAAAAE